MSRIYLEGGGESKELHARCRQAFRKLLERAGFTGRMPRLFASGDRNSTFDDFQTANRDATEYVALFVDSEDAVADVNRPWDHLEARDGWKRPTGATDEQALLMITSMETWIACDRAAIRQRFGSRLREAALPPLVDLEKRNRADVFAALKAATKDCPEQYSKGSIAFQTMALVSADVLDVLAGFARVQRVLKSKL